MNKPAHITDEKNFSSYFTDTENYPASLITQKFPEFVELKLYEIYKKLIPTFGCTYMFIFYEDSFSSQKIGFSTNPGWREHFIGKNLIEHCPFRVEVRRRFLSPQTRKIIIPWNTIPPQDSNQRRIIYERRNYEIDNGISFCQKIGSVRETIAFAAELNHYDFAKSIIFNMPAINQTILELRKTVSPYLQQLIFLQIRLNATRNKH